MIASPPHGLDASGRAGWAALFGPPIAHRGLWKAGGAPENSHAAFETACAAGYGVELDVQASADGIAMVFHDATLARMMGRRGAIADHTAAELGRLRLAGSDEPVPTLADALARVAGRTLVLVELKTRPGGEGPLEAAVAALLDDYAGPVATISFHPASTAWFARHRPQTLRGLNAEAGEAALTAAPAHFTLPSLQRLADPAVARLRAEGRPVVAWTVRSEEEAVTARSHADNLIFEGFPP